MEGSEHDLLEINGVVSGVAGSVLTITKKDGTTVSVTIDAQTIVDAGDHAGTVADLVAGVAVEVAARGQRPTARSRRSQSGSKPKVRTVTSSMWKAWSHP